MGFLTPSSYLSSNLTSDDSRLFQDNDSYSSESLDDEPYIDNAFDILQANIATPLPGPYSTTWTPDARTLWSASLIKHGKLDCADAALLAFTVDCAMKVYITADLDLPCLEHMNQDDLVWTIIYKAYWVLIRARSSHNRAMSALEQFLVFVVEDLPKLRERCRILFGQHMQDPESKATFALNIVAHVKFHDVQPIISKVFLWVYGE
jgi:hypothetical protein